jgi:hypothetical protein
MGGGPGGPAAFPVGFELAAQVVVRPRVLARHRPSRHRRGLAGRLGPVKAVETSGISCSLFAIASRRNSRSSPFDS